MCNDMFKEINIKEMSFNPITDFGEIVKTLVKRGGKYDGQGEKNLPDKNAY